MSQNANGNAGPPKLEKDPSGSPLNSSIADIIEWFLNYDERTARMRHPQTDELFEWKQADDEKQGIGIFPFENAEARFAIGVVQAVAENRDEESLKNWITDVLEALGRARELRGDVTTSYDLDSDPEAGWIQKAEKLPSNSERRLYLSACWLESLCTAEARVLGWIYQELFGKQYSPS